LLYLIYQVDYHLVPFSENILPKSRSRTQSLRRNHYFIPLMKNPTPSSLPVFSPGAPALARLLAPALAFALLPAPARAAHNASTWNGSTSTDFVDNAN
jgi:hypothetical protein